MKMRIVYRTLHFWGNREEGRMIVDVVVDVRKIIVQKLTQNCTFQFYLTPVVQRVLIVPQLKV